jgi:hypothetical protein
LTTEERAAVEKTAAITAHLDRELAALGADAALGSMFVIGWLVGQLGQASGAEPGDETGLEPVLGFIRRAWADGVTRGAAKRGLIH